MKSLLTHILTHHNYRKYAYISGPHTNTESFRRTEAFTDVMHDYHILPENISVYEGDFSIKSAMQAVDYFFDEQNFIPDIVICANDEMAIGVHEALIARGIDMPDRIAFTGFDDIDNATTFVPAFTTIRQPIYEIGKASVQGLHQLITNQVKSFNKSLAGALVVRESCGCFNVLDNRYLLNKETHLEITPTSLPVGDTLIIETIQSIDIAYQGKYAKEVHELLAVLILELKNDLPAGSFLKNLSKVCYQAVSSDASLFDGRWFVTWLRKSLIAYNALHLSIKLTEIIYECALIVGDMLIRNERRSNYDFLELYYASSELILELTQVTEVEQLFQTIIPYLTSFNFDEFYVCLFDEPLYFEGNDTFIYPDEMNMQLRYTKHGALPPCRYHTKTIIQPDLLGIDSEHHFTFYPLFFRKAHFGYIMCTVDIASRSIFRTIKEQIANTLERLRVNKQLEAYTLQLHAYNKQLADMAIKDAMTGLLNRRGIFEYLDLVLEDAQVTGKCIGVVYSDIDGLKSINDAYGHQAGDAAINAISNVLFEVFSPYGEVARVGGDEFICILTKHEEDGYIESLFQQVIASLQVYNAKNLEPFQLSVSMGFARWDPTGHQTMNQVLNESDKALYRNKEKFRA
jgi:diguanylate cyclase (GGDEF)-like protein